MANLGTLATYEKVKLPARQWRRVFHWCYPGFEVGLEWLNQHRPLDGADWTLDTVVSLPEVVELLGEMSNEESPTEDLFGAEYDWLMSVTKGTGSGDWTEDVIRQIEYFASLPKEGEASET